MRLHQGSRSRKAIAILFNLLASLTTPSVTQIARYQGLWWQWQKIKVKVILQQATKAQEGEYMYSFTLSSASALDGGGWSTPRPCRFTTGKDPVPIYRRLGGPQGRSGRVWKISSPPGFDLRTVQTVASRYTDWAIRPTMSVENKPENWKCGRKQTCRVWGVTLELFRKDWGIPRNITNMIKSRGGMIRETRVARIGKMRSA
jgi:hypothetical protein